MPELVRAVASIALSAMPPTHKSGENPHGFALAHKTQTFHPDLAHPSRLPCGRAGGRRRQVDRGSRESARPRSCRSRRCSGRSIASSALSHDLVRHQGRRTRRRPQARARTRRTVRRLPGGVSIATLESIASCESGGDPTAVSSDGTYRGKYQFDYGTWESVGGTATPPPRPRPSRTTARRCSTRTPAPVPGPSAAERRPPGRKARPLPTIRP